MSRNLVIHAAARKGNVENLRAVIEDGASVDAVDIRQNIAIHWASMCDKKDGVDVLVEAEHMRPAHKDQRGRWTLSSGQVRTRPSLTMRAADVFGEDVDEDHRLADDVERVRRLLAYAPAEATWSCAVLTQTGCNRIRTKAYSGRSWGTCEAVVVLCSARRERERARAPRRTTAMPPIAPGGNLFWGRVGQTALLTESLGAAGSTEEPCWRLLLHTRPYRGPAREAVEAGGEGWKDVSPEGRRYRVLEESPAVSAKAARWRDRQLSNIRCIDSHAAGINARNSSTDFCLDCCSMMDGRSRFIVIRCAFG